MTDPSPLHELNAISLLCQREGILKPDDHPTTLGQVVALLSRATRNESDAAHQRQQFQQARLACYSLSVQAGQLQHRLEEMDRHAEEQLDTTPRLDRGLSG